MSFINIVRHSLDITKTSLTPLAFDIGNKFSFMFITHYTN